MKQISVSQAKRNLSALLAEVRGGETVLVTVRGEAVAQIKPIDTDPLTDRAATELVKEGIANPPRAGLDLPTFLAEPRPRLPEGYSARRLIADERNDGR